MFSANPSISPTRLKPLDMAKGRGNGVRPGGDGVGLGNGVGLEEEWIRTRGNGVGLEGNGIRQGGTGLDWEGTGLDWGGNKVGLEGNGVGLRGNRVGLKGNKVGLGENGVGLGGERDRTRGRIGDRIGGIRLEGLDWGGWTGYGRADEGMGQS